MSHIQLPGIPSPLSWYNQPVDWNLTADNRLTITAGAKTDWFSNPQGAQAIINAPALLFKSQQPCLLSAYITVDYAATFDAGVLALFINPQTWAKFCLELSPQGQLTIVSVVNKDKSDDCNAFSIEGRSTYLRIARLNRAIAFHHSHDGVKWSLIRHFTLGDHSEVSMGFLMQSPTGNGCTAHFSSIQYEARLLADIRSGD